MSSAEPTPSSDRAQIRVARVIKALLASRGQTQVDLARVLNIDQTAVSRILNGSRRMTVDELDLIGAYFDVGWDVFAAGPESLFRSRWFSPLSLVSGIGGQMELDFTERPSLTSV